MPLFFIYFEGFFVSLSLIAAIGMQNAFVLEQSIRKNHVYLVLVLCVCFDMAFFWLGAYSIGFVKQSLPNIFDILRWVGVGFLIFYGMRALVFCFKTRSEGLIIPDNSNGEILQSDEKKEAVFKKKAAQKNTTKVQIIIMTSAVTLLNPHFYIDTFFLLGSLATEYQAGQKIIFLLGASGGSIAWYFLLTFLGKRLSSFFQNVLAWRILDGIISAMMFFWAYTLAFSFNTGAY